MIRWNVHFVESFHAIPKTWGHENINAQFGIILVMRIRSSDVRIAHTCKDRCFSKFFTGMGSCKMLFALGPSQEKEWFQYLPPTDRDPDDIGSSLSRAISRDDLPHPTGPTTATSCPGLISRFMSLIPYTSSCNVGSWGKNLNPTLGVMLSPAVHTLWSRKQAKGTSYECPHHRFVILRHWCAVIWFKLFPQGSDIAQFDDGFHGVYKVFRFVFSYRLHIQRFLRERGA